ncbi:hypothetical protein EJB05_47105 [Eragrostis curvula]|uniref:Uncharacterized protein n=1 Tax=Eragrostis curvula TaxID=38414 RepID=A0A5J9T6U1_9POAL|nr:hypothetical protein EJB05_47105 [Eragrostis curvula]
MAATAGDEKATAAAASGTPECEAVVDSTYSSRARQWRISPTICGGPSSRLLLTPILIACDLTVTVLHAGGGYRKREELTVYAIIW